MDTPRRLATWPTPVEAAPRLAAALGLGPEDLLIKRDDLAGLGGGGNKIRKLEWTLGAALAEGADTLVTSGAPQSNHARLTAAAAARAGLASVLVFPGQPGGSGSGNLALDGLFGARIVWAGAVDHDGLAARTAQVAAQLPNAALIPFGGSSPIGVRGYVEGGRELLDQVPDLTTVVVALGSGGTMAGLVAALGPGRVLGVHTGALDDPAPIVTELANSVADAPIDAAELRLRFEQVGSTEAVATAMLLAARTEGLVLDPIYTGRAMAALVAAVADGSVRPGERTVFLHTGGLPGLFSHPEALARAEAALG